METLQSFEKKKKLLIAKMKEEQSSDSSFSLHKKTSNLFRPKFSERQTKSLDVTSFNQVLSIDPVSFTAEVEGMTTYEDFVDATLAYSLLPAVVPELKSITVGGAAAGLGIESSSFRYGLVYETILEIEILLSDGMILVCTPDNENRDLFLAFPNTYGTFGYALRLKVKLIPAKKYIKLKHYAYSSSFHFFEDLANLCQANRQPSSPIAYIDGTIFKENSMFLTLGEFVDEAPQVSNYSYMRMYYKSIQQLKEDYLTVKDYIWRWDTDWFWCSYVFGMQNSLLRFLFGKWMLTSKVYTRMMHFFHRHPKLSNWMAGSNQTESIIQDVLIPCDRAEEFLDFLYKVIPIRPIWICPTKIYQENRAFSFCPLDESKLYIDFGFWGSIQSQEQPGYYNREVEKMAVKLEGLKSLYSKSYYTEAEFWNIYNESLYKGLKEKYDSKSHLRGLYEKCCFKG